MISAEMTPPIASDHQEEPSVGAATTSITETSVDSDTSTVTKMRAEFLRGAALDLHADLAEVVLYGAIREIALHAVEPLSKPIRDRDLCRID